MKPPFAKALTLSLSLGAFVSACVAQTAPQPATANLPIASAQPVPQDFFGIVIAGYAAKQSWPRVPAHSVRIFDAAWCNLEAVQGQWNWQLLDKIVATAVQNHADLDLVIGFPPSWASARPTEQAPGHTPLGTRAEPANMSDWENYVRTLSTRYRGRVHTYEIWNEPNTKESYTGDVPTLVKVSASAYRTLKQVDPSITVISSSPAPNNTAFPFMRQFLTAGGGTTFDVLGYHFYDNLARPQINPENFLGIADHARLLLKDFHLQSKPIWDTESGYYIQSAPAASHRVTSFPSYVRPIGQEEAVAAVGRSFICAWAAGVTRLYWYAWAEPQYALADDMGATDKPATVAYRTIAKWLEGASFTSFTRTPDNLWTLTLKQRDGHTAWIVWATKQDVPTSLPASVHASKISLLDGTESTLKGDTLTVTQQPVLLR